MSFSALRSPRLLLVLPLAAAMAAGCGMPRDNHGAVDTAAGSPRIVEPRAGDSLEGGREAPRWMVGSWVGNAFWDSVPAHRWNVLLTVAPTMSASRIYYWRGGDTCSYSLRLTGVLDSTAAIEEILPDPAASPCHGPGTDLYVKFGATRDILVGWYLGTLGHETGGAFVFARKKGTAGN